MFEKNKESHGFQRIHTVWSYKYMYVKSTMSSLFDSLGTIIWSQFVTKARNLSNFPTFLDNPVHRNFYFLKQYRI